MDHLRQYSREKSLIEKSGRKLDYNQLKLPNSEQVNTSSSKGRLIIQFPEEQKWLHTSESVEPSNFTLNLDLKGNFTFNEGSKSNRAKNTPRKQYPIAYFTQNSNNHINKMYRTQDLKNNIKKQPLFE